MAGAGTAISTTDWKALVKDDWKALVEDDSKKLKPAQASDTGRTGPAQTT